MEAVTTFYNVIRIQQALSVIGTLMLTAYLFPKQAIVEGNLIIIYYFIMLYVFDISTG